MERISPGFIGGIIALIVVLAAFAGVTICFCVRAIADWRDVVQTPQTAAQQKSTFEQRVTARMERDDEQRARRDDIELGVPATDGRWWGGSTGWMRGGCSGDVRSEGRACNLN